MCKKKVYILSIIYTTLMLIVGCESNSSNFTESSSTNNIVENTQESEISEGESENPTISESDTDELEEIDDDGNYIMVYSDNPDIDEIEGEPYYSGVSEILTEFIEAFVSCRYEDAQKKCIPNSVAYKLAETYKYHEESLKIEYVQNITNPFVPYGDEKKDKALKENRNSIIGNKYLKNFFSVYEDYLYRDPVIMNITEDSRRSITYELALSIHDDTDIFTNHISNYFSFEDLIKADFFKDYYNNNSQKIDSLYDKYESELDGKNAVLVKFFDDNGKDFFENELEKLNADFQYSTYKMIVVLNKIDSKWGVADFGIIDVDDYYDELLYGSIYTEDDNLDISEDVYTHESE